jgi:hypothetical protein
MPLSEPSSRPHWLARRSRTRSSANFDAVSAWLRSEERSKRLVHVHVLGFKFEQLGQRIRHRLKAAT